MARHNLHAACVALLSLVGPCALAASENSSALEPVRAQLRVKNFIRAAELLRPLAEANNTQAELLLASLYRQGLGVNADTGQAQKWLTRAAEQGDAQAMYELATILGAATTPDHELIQQWLQRAASAGYKPATDALHDKVAPLRFQPALLADQNARRAAFWLAASRNDTAQLAAFTDTSLLKVSDEFGRTALAYAARAGAIHASEWLLQAGADPNQADSFGVTPLMLAAGSGQLAVITSLIKSAAHANAQDKSGNNALMYAIGRRHDDCVAALLPIIDIKQRNAQGWSALDWAVNADNATLIARLRGMGMESTRKPALASSKPAIPLQHAGNNDLYSSWPDVLIASTRAGTELFEAVVQISPNALRGQEAAALLLAVQSENTALIDRLLARGAAVDPATNETPLSWSVRHAKPEMAQRLLASGIKPDAHGKNEVAPILDVVRSSDPSALDTMNLLLKAGANPDARDRSGRTALMISAQMQQSQLAGRLLQSGTDAELADNTGRTALMYAAQTGSTDVVRQLLVNKAAIDKRDRDDNSALMLAAVAGNADAVSTLVAAGASTRGNKAGVTALMLAAAAGQEDIVKKLLSAGMKTDAQDKHGDTALIYAARRGQGATVRALLAAGADAGLRNNDRASARDVAERLAFRDVTTLLAQR